MKAIRVLVMAVLLGAISVTVESAPSPPPSRFVWAAPATYSDGAPVQPGDIASYEIMDGPSSGAYTNTVAIPDPTATSATIASVLTTPGPHYVAIMAIDRYGQRGQLSNEVFVFLDQQSNPVIHVLVAPGNFGVQ